MAKREINAVFEVLGLRTEKDRERFDFVPGEPETSSDQEATFIRVENESCIDEGAEDAELEPDSR